VARLGIVKVKGEKDVNCFVVSCTGTRDAIVVDPVEPAAKVLDQLSGLTLRWIVATHGHPGHLAGKDEVHEAAGGTTGLHVSDAKQFLRSAERYLVDGDELDLGDFVVRVIHTPGHTPGSLCFLIGNHLFTGDTLLAGGIGREMPETDVRQQLISIHGKLARLPLSTAIYPGHGPVTSLENEIRTNPVFQVARR
jgi:glyoxylase-like metal-dependent hydrolase (beta-lactamase superfamily II)